MRRWRPSKNTRRRWADPSAFGIRDPRSTSYTWPLDLPTNYLQCVEEAISKVEATRDDEELAAVESKLATERQNQYLQEGKDWRRKVTARTHRAARMGASDTFTIRTRRRYSLTILRRRGAKPKTPAAS